MWSKAFIIKLLNKEITTFLEQAWLMRIGLLYTSHVVLKVINTNYLCVLQVRWNLIKPMRFSVKLKGSVSVCVGKVTLLLFQTQKFLWIFFNPLSAKTPFEVFFIYVNSFQLFNAIPDNSKHLLLSKHSRHSWRFCLCEAL